MTDDRSLFIEVLALLANGSIARRLALTPKAVANHVSSVLAELQLPDRAAARLRTRRAGLGESQQLVRRTGEMSREVG
jgi:DNA-binding NarL/FixJ family response regulator